MYVPKIGASDDTRLATGTPSQNALLTSSSLCRLSIPPDGPESECQEQSTEYSNNDNVGLVVVTFACDIKT
jgi:hypothetical protein